MLDPAFTHSLQCRPHDKRPLQPYYDHTLKLHDISNTASHLLGAAHVSNHIPIITLAVPTASMQPHISQISQKSRKGALAATQASSSRWLMEDARRLPFSVHLPKVSSNFLGGNLGITVVPGGAFDIAHHNHLTYDMCTVPHQQYQYMTHTLSNKPFIEHSKCRVHGIRPKCINLTPNLHTHPLNVCTLTYIHPLWSQLLMQQVHQLLLDCIL